MVCVFRFPHYYNNIYIIIFILFHDVFFFGCLTEMQYNTVKLTHVMEKSTEYNVPIVCEFMKPLNIDRSFELFWHAYCLDSMLTRGIYTARRIPCSSDVVQTGIYTASDKMIELNIAKNVHIQENIEMYLCARYCLSPFNSFVISIRKLLNYYNLKSLESMPIDYYEIDAGVANRYGLRVCGSISRVASTIPPVASVSGSDKIYNSVSEINNDRILLVSKFPDSFVSAIRKWCNNNYGNSVCNLFSDSRRKRLEFDYVLNCFVKMYTLKLNDVCFITRISSVSNQQHGGKKKIIATKSTVIIDNDIIYNKPIGYYCCTNSRVDQQTLNDSNDLLLKKTLAYIRYSMNVMDIQCCIRILLSKFTNVLNQTHLIETRINIKSVFARHYYRNDTVEYMISEGLNTWFTQSSDDGVMFYNDKVQMVPTTNNLTDRNSLTVTDGVKLDRTVYSYNPTFRLVYDNSIIEFIESLYKLNGIKFNLNNINIDVNNRCEICRGNMCM